MDDYRNLLTPLDDELTDSEASDTSNAENFARLYGHCLRYDHRRGRWLVWNGHRWQPDEDEEVLRMAVMCSKTLYDQAWNLPKELSQKLSKWAIASQSRYRIEACIAMSKAFHPIADKGDQWDLDPWLLGVGNGVVDLRTGELRDGRPEDRITMSTGIDFEPEAECPRWLQFLDEVFADSDLIDWVHRALGYALTGDTSEQDLFVGYGKGANGKDVFRRAIEYTLGDYAHTTPFSTFELHQRASIPNDVAALESKRFVNASETNDNTRLNEARIKALVGGGRQTARYLHREFFTFEPHLKLWLFVNHRPKVVDESYGFWRRVKLIPFLRTFQGKGDDKNLSAKLKAEAPGILAWLVLGCLKWQQRSIEDMPKCVKEATHAYRTESDVLAGFIAARCTESSDSTVRAGDLYSSYKEWAKDEGITDRDKDFLSATAFGRRMTSKYNKRQVRGCFVYEGIGLAHSEERLG